MKLGLGTVQFGQAYGVSNTHGQVTAGDAAAILARAAQAGVSVLDTAANYGEAESVLAKLDTTPFRIVTKTISVRGGVTAVVARARQSAKALGADTLLVHAAADLEDVDLWPSLQALKAEGVYRKIGISVYVADDPVALAARYRPDVMQLPFSLLDQRLLQDGTLAKLKAHNVEIHARSIFLQGLLFLDTLPEKLRHIAPQLAAIKTAIANAGSTPLAAALGFVLSQPEIDIAVVGVTAPVELDEVLAAAALPLPDLDWRAMALNDETVLTPSRWSL
jgi:aryl-alcohol dehydrogenase-like predicted oxidoreductase